MYRSLLFLVVSVIANVVTIGCTDQKPNYGLVDLVNAGGSITLDGKPLANAVVTFEDPSDGTFSYAQTDSSGNYSLQFDSRKSGVSTGEKIVRVSTTRKILGLNSSEGGEGAEESPEEDGAADSSVELVPDKYNKESELKITVESGKTSYNFDLVSGE